LLTLKKTVAPQIASLSLNGLSVNELLSKEWLLTNERGSYASSTLIGCNTRRYHGLLVGSLRPPVDRIVGLSSCLETVIVQKVAQQLGSFEFDDRIMPAGWRSIRRFRRDGVGVHFEYSLGEIELTKSVYLAPRQDTIGLVYDFKRISQPIEFTVRPFIALRDFHTLQKSYARLYSDWLGDELLIRHNVPHSCELLLRAGDMWFVQDSQWWFEFVYRVDKQRGQDFNEDLWTPGFFKCCIETPRKVVLWASLSDGRTKNKVDIPDIDVLCDELLKHSNSTIGALKTKDREIRQLCLAAEQFIVKRQLDESRYTSTILAGFPWFADWGRDAFVALPGLLLTRGKIDEAGSVLATFAQTAQDGMIANCFDDYGDTLHYNSIDASLWFINAAFEYLKTGGNVDVFEQELLPKIRWIVDCYYNGTKFGIHADADGLITGGTAETQLTWMDANFDGRVFTPRHGKAVEVNALWYNTFCCLAEYFNEKDGGVAEHYSSVAQRVGEAFRRVFWNESAGCLYDCIFPDGTADQTLRPNQIYAVSLLHSALTDEQQKRVVDVCQEKLLTPYGLRTLDVNDPSYHGSYEGMLAQRDEAYHQGTVWPHLIGPFIEAYLKVNKFSKTSRKEATEFIYPLLEHLTENACLGSISEIFDAEPPHCPRGCIAQAWAVAEVLRAYLLIQD